MPRRRSSPILGRAHEGPAGTASTNNFTGQITLHESNLERQPLHPILSCDRSTPPFVVKQPSFGRNVAMGLGCTRRCEHSGKDHHSDQKLELVGHPVPGVRRRRMAIVIDSPAGLLWSSLPCVGGPFRCYRNKNLTKRANC